MASKEQTPGGEVTINDPGDYQGGLNQSAPIRIVAVARVNADGSVSRNKGFSNISRIAAGEYHLDLTDQIVSDKLVTMANITEGEPAGIANSSSSGLSSIEVDLFDLAGVLTDSQFNVVVFTFDIPE